jgi:hypothetical protein
MRLMTGVTGEPSGVIRRGNLRKARRLGSVSLMTTSTHHGRVQLRRLHGTGIVCVLGQSPVASLARDYHMLAKLFLIHDLGVAGLAGIVPCKRNRPRRDLTDCRPSIVAILAETVRDDGGSQNYECY